MTYLTNPSYSCPIPPVSLPLPQLVLLIMSVPVLVIYLPVFVAAAQDYERSSQHIDYVCAITNVPEKVCAMPQ